MELRHLRYFVAVADAEHFGRAAERIHVSQPALSQQIHDLEQEVGAPLFERHSRGVRLTPAGEVFIGHARAALKAAAAGVAEAREVAQGTAGRIVVGLAETSAAAGLAMRAIAALRARLPKVEVETTGLPWLEHPRALLAGAINVGFCWSPGESEPLPSSYPQGITAERLYHDPGDHALVPAGHPLAAREAVSAKALRSLPFGLFERDLHPGLHDAIVEAAGRANLGTVALAQGVASVAASVSLVIARQGWTLVTRSISAEPLPGTVALPIVGFSVPAGLDVIHRTSEQPSILHAFVGELRSNLVGGSSPLRWASARRWSRQ